MPFDVRVFTEKPNLDLIKANPPKKDDWIFLAKHYCVTVKAGMTKNEIRASVVNSLVLLKLLPEEALELCKSDSDKRLSEHFQNLEATSREVLKEESDRQFQIEKLKLEKEKLALEKEKLDRELELAWLKGQQPDDHSLPDSPAFDLTKVSRLVPRFDESDPDVFFRQFEKTATTLSWPKEFWTILIQTVLTGKGALVYSNLAVEESKDYDLVKRTILAAYELTAEGYRQQFRKLQKHPDKTYVEFANDKCRAFMKWINSCLVKDFDTLCNLMVLEEFKRCIPVDIRLYIEDREITLLKKAAIAADSYSLSHKPKNQSGGGRNFNVKSVSVGSPEAQIGTNSKFSQYNVAKNAKNDLFCSYYKKAGHSISDCWSKNCKQSKHYDPSKNKSTESKSQALMNINIQPVENRSVESEGNSKDEIAEEQLDKEDLYEGFKFGGKVSLVKGDPSVNVTILRDTGGTQSVLVGSCLPGIEKALTEEKVYIRDFSGISLLPLARVYLVSDLVSGFVNVAVSSKPLPVSGVQFLLGNDLAGNLVVPDPIVVEKPLLEDPSADLVREFPDIFPSCVVTRSQSRKADKNVPEGKSKLDVYQLPISKESLIEAQKNDPTLSGLLSKAVDTKDRVTTNPGFYFEGGVLMRKFRPVDCPSEEWSETCQVVLPNSFREDVIHMAHDRIQGHLGVYKTFQNVLAHFFWPKMKSDVSKYIKSCHICQVVGKVNKPIPPAPLAPIPVVSVPFYKVIVDCVGPLPRSKKGNQYLLTIMCSMTRYPEAIPLRNIKSKSVVQALLKFFTYFGVPKIIQHDQGSNFTSKLFAEVMKGLGINQCLSTAYHPESQGALERFHQTFKTMIKKYCLETQSEWDEGYQYLLFAVRESKNESLQYSPFELLFGRQVRGPLRIFKESLLNGDSSGEVQSFSQYFQKLKSTLSRVHAIAVENLKESQEKMKSNYDRKTEVRTFQPGEKVLVLIPVSNGPFEAKYSGPYTVKEKVDDLNYIINTPDRRKRTRKVHVNLIKGYYDRATEADSLNNSVSGTQFNLNLSNSVPICTVSGDVDFGLNGCDYPVNNSQFLVNFKEKSNHLVGNQAHDLLCLFDKYNDVVKDSPGLCTIMKHDVVLTEGAIPIKQSPYRLNPQKRHRMKEAVQYLLENGLAEPCFSPWASPCLLALKEDGSDRLCTDFRKVNQVTVTDSFPLPRLDDLIDSVGNAKFVTKIDLQKGYYQVLLTPKASEISAFVTPDGLYKYLRMPFGMKNAPGTFQRIINFVIRDLNGIFAYLDDLIIVSETWSEHIEKLHNLFSRLSEAGLTINLKKCVFGGATVTYLGHEVGQGMLKPKSAKIDAILNFPVPTDRKSPMHFLGMAGFYRCFCRNFSNVVAPLTALLSPKKPYQWSQDCQQAFENVKLLLSTDPVLRSPDFSRPFELHVDACDYGAGAVLFQRDATGFLHPVSYFSSKFKKHQFSYATIEKEALSLVLALEHFRYFLHDSPYPVCIRTDHNPLRFINKMQNSNQRLMRWAIMLQEYNLEIYHIKGTENIIPDTLSRSG